MSKADKGKKKGTANYRFARVFLGFFIKLIRRIHIKGSENEPDATKGPYLLICNHLRWSDPIWVCTALRWQQPHFMAKKELFSVPLLGPMIRSLGAYPVDRGGSDVGTVRKTIDMLKSGTCVGMFPQAHRRPGLDPRSTAIKAGAAMIAVRAGVPILPVYIKTKDNKPKLFRKVEIIVGKPITLEEMGYTEGVAGEYNRIAAYAFEKVCALGDGAEGTDA